MAAAFRRLCVETSRTTAFSPAVAQPPSGGCVLKPATRAAPPNWRSAAFRRLCVETSTKVKICANNNPAAFRRLCVETTAYTLKLMACTPAAFRRLCVETQYRPAPPNRGGQPPSGGCVLKLRKIYQAAVIGPAAFRRLCVETGVLFGRETLQLSAAFRRLCVETRDCSQVEQWLVQPPSGGCVLKPQMREWVGTRQTAAFRRLCVETAYDLPNPPKARSRLQAAVC